VKGVDNKILSVPIGDGQHVSSQCTTVCLCCVELSLDWEEGVTVVAVNVQVAVFDQVTWAVAQLNSTQLNSNFNGFNNTCQRIRR
jgi:hypothetical protein